MNNNYLPVSKKDTKQDYYMAFYNSIGKYAVDINYVTEVINMPEIELPVQMQEGVIGIFNYKGVMVEAVDLCSLLGFEPGEFSVNNRIIVVKNDGRYFGIHSTAIDNIIIPEIEKTQFVPFGQENSIIKLIYKGDKENVNLIDIELLDKMIEENKNQKGSINYKSLIPSDEKSKEIFKLRTVQNKKNPEKFSFSFSLNAVNQYVLLTLSDNYYYLDLKYVKEFVSCRKLAIVKLPYTDDFIIGLTNIKGEFLIVVDLKYLLNNEKSEMESNGKLIVTEGKNYNIALYVDDVKYIKNLNNLQTAISNSTFSKYIFSEFVEDDKLYGIINFEKIINDDRLFINIE